MLLYNKTLVPFRIIQIFVLIMNLSKRIIKILFILLLLSINVWKIIIPSIDKYLEQGILIEVSTDELDGLIPPDITICRETSDRKYGAAIPARGNNHIWWSAQLTPKIKKCPELQRSPNSILMQQPSCSTGEQVNDWPFLCCPW